MTKNANRAPSAEEIEAFLAEKAKNEAKAKAKAKPANGGRRTSAQVQEDHPNTALHFCTIIGGRKFDEGTVVECHWVGVNKFGQDTARIFDKNGKPFLEEGRDKGWINPKFLKPGKALPKERVAAIEASRETDSDETILVPASVGLERDKSVLLNYSGWFSGMWMPKSMVTKVGDMDDGRGIFEIPAWKVRKEKGPDALESLRSKQEALQEAVA